MPEFAYQVIDPLGRDIKGKVHAANDDAARAVLAKKNFYVVKLNEAEARRSVLSDLQRRRRRLSTKQLTLFTRQFSSLIQVSPLEEAIRTISRQSEQAHVRDILGNYDAYRRIEEERSTQKSADRKEAAEEKQVAKQNAVKTKLSFKEKHELEQLEKEVPRLEEEKKMLEEKLNSNLTDHEELLKVTAKLGEIVSELDEKGLRWLELSEMPQ